MKRNILFILGVLVIFGFTKMFMGGGAPEDEVKAALANKALVVDVRTPGEFAEGSAINAVNIPLNEIIQADVQLDKEATVVVFCQSGNRSTQAQKLLKQQGFKDVVNGGTWINVLDIQKQLN